MTSNKHEPVGILTHSLVCRQRHHDGGKALGVAALAHERHPLVVLEPQSFGGHANSIVRAPNSCTPRSGARRLRLHDGGSLPDGSGFSAQPRRSDTAAAFQVLAGSTRLLVDTPSDSAARDKVAEPTRLARVGGCAENPHGRCEKLWSATAVLPGRSRALAVLDSAWRRSTAHVTSRALSRGWCQRGRCQLHPPIADGNCR